MNKKDLLFYDAYEEFYTMSARSKAFQAYCREAFGEDFSQDGFSDIEQINRILPYIPKHENVHILDVGCGNGKMLGYLQEKTGAHIHGFDYSEQAIQTAQELHLVNAEFRVGVIGEVEYEQGQFDVIISMDTMYFAKDMSAFLAQVKRWLKPEGIFFAGYQEGDVMPKTKGLRETALAKAIKQNGMQYEADDITAQTYKLLQKKRLAAMKHQADLEAEGHENWYEMLIGQTECATVSFEQFKEQMARYLYVVRK